MKLKVGEFLIESDNLQFVVKQKSTVKEGHFTKEENIGKEVYKPVAYCVKFCEVLKYITDQVLRTNDDIGTILDKLEQINLSIAALERKPVIYIKEEPKSKVKIVSDEEMRELENE